MKEFKDFKVLLVYPNFPMASVLLPAGISIISAVLKKEGFQCKLFDTTLYKPKGESQEEYRKKLHQIKTSSNMEEKVKTKASNPHDDFKYLINSYKPDVVGISVLSDTFEMGVEYAKIAKEKNLPVFAGGIYPTFAPEEVIENKYIDYVCMGEGEYAVANLCKSLAKRKSIDNIKNFWIKKKDGSIIKNGLGPLVNVNELPYPDYSIFEPERFYRPMQGKVLKILPIELHRGCPYTCAYCEDPSQNLLYRSKGIAKTYHRSKSPKRVIDELHYLINTYGANYIYFNAETFFAMPNKNFIELADLYSKEIKLPFWIQTRPETITEERIRLLKNMGVSNINVGIEHGNEVYRWEMLKRSMSNKLIIEALTILDNAGIPVTVNNIMGFPDETRELIFDTINLNRSIKSATINAYLYNPYPGTILYEVCKKKGYLPKEGDEKAIDTHLSTEVFPYFKTILNLPTISKAELCGLQKTFVLYSKLPRSEFKRIKIAEQHDEEGNAMFELLSKEYKDVIQGKVQLPYEIKEYLG
jgi:radical SAM superfamily enzyme YgiQ (UPF0313 family)|tara:strand:+ start:15044 stop:16624 length:1581 start_codon:yes stop_codon:yes gene_type:complete